MASLLVGCETALYMINRLKAYMDFFIRLPLSLPKTNFEAALTEMYASILTFLARAIEIYQQSTFRRAFTALWQASDLQDFERGIKVLADKVEVEASNCDRTLARQDRGLLGQLQQELQTVLEEVEQIHKVQVFFERIEKKIDLNRLKVIEGASFDAYGQIHQACHPATRVDLLRHIQDWAQQPDSQSIFWLNGMAGTGKSTISCTVAKWLVDQGFQGTARLGASFFFKRGEADRGSAALLFPTIAGQLATRINGFDVLIAKAIDVDPYICSKALGEQFKRLIYEPLQQLTSIHDPSTYVVVLDALDECENEDDVQTVLQLWSSLPQMANIHLRLFLTSRPDLPIRLGFKKLSGDKYRDIVLHEVPQPVIQHDILVFLEDALTNFRKEYNLEPLGIPLNDEWPGLQTLQLLTDMAVPLFIVAATTYRLISDLDHNPEEQLKTILASPKLSHLPQTSQVYLPILQKMTVSLRDKHDKEKLNREFQIIIGSIITLAEPLSRTALATLLDIPLSTVVLSLRPLHSVLYVPEDVETPVRPLHLSFGEFLTSEEIQDEPFGVNGPATHGMLLSKCLQLLSGPDGLRQNICSLAYPGQPRSEIMPAHIHQYLTSAIRYACRYWVHHAKYSAFQLSDEDEVYAFLQNHFLHWLEALSLLDQLVDAIECISILQSIISVSAMLQPRMREMT